MNGHDLLKEFRDERSEKAFAELVRRYAGLVYSVAKRRLANANLAEDVTQIVFIRFAKNPPKLQSDAELAAWLHRTTVNVTIDTWRSETRRSNREKQTIVMEPTTSENTLWEELSPNLDEALNQLKDEDRHALMLRFFDRKAMREIGTALGVSEDAAKMRVSRALEQMRTQLGVGGSACAAAVLESILEERSVHAAPVQLVSRLAAMKLPAAVGVAGVIRPLVSLLRISKFNLATGAVVLSVIVVSIVHLVRSPNEPISEVATSNSQTISTGNMTGVASRPRTAASSLRPPAAPPQKPVKMYFQVMEAESGAGVRNARIKACYFGVGGADEGHDLLTDNTGIAAIPEPDDVTKKQAMNVFVAAEGYVPKVVNFHGGTTPADYTIKLDRAMTAGGWVADERGLPVVGVRIMIQSPGNQPGRMENVDFQTCPVTNHEDGSWSCSYIPKDYTNEITFILQKSGYAITRPVVPASRVDLTNLVLIINRGFTVTGQISDQQNRPVVNARVKTLGQGRSARTDEHGVFSLEGVDEFSISTLPPIETNENGAAVIRGLANRGPVRVDLAVQAEGFAPQTQRLELSGVTSVANFTLSPGNILRGHVLDETGAPIPNAVIRTDWDFKNQIATQFDWTTNTDGNGWFEWDSAPAEAICYWFEADGYSVVRSMPLLADGSDHEITLKRDAIK